MATPDSPPADSLHSQKRRLRARLKQARAALNETQRSDYSKKIISTLEQTEAFRQARRIFAFVSYHDEVETHTLLQQMLRQECALSVPFICDRTTMQSRRIRAWSDLKADVLGILAPVAGETDSGPYDLVITPGLGFNESGHRIGYGAGYYDRWFEQHEYRYSIALAFEAQITAEIPIDEHDIPIDCIITEQRILTIKPWR